jgi:hypothetical protein
MRGVGRVVFVTILLLIAGALNVLYGIAAEGNTHFFSNTQFAFSSLHTWGWITVIIGIIQLVGAISLLANRGFGLVIGIAAASLGAVESLLSIGGTHPLWALGVFAICLWVLHGLVIYGTEQTAGA